MINNIKEGIAYIHSLPKTHKNSDLNFMKKILTEFNNPQDEYEVIHITGTNGKGSVAHYTDKMLINSGYKVGMFTSPYIVEFKERFQINDQFIDDADLLHLINEIKDKVASLDSDFFLVEFEFVTVLGLLYFSRQNVEVAVIEVGIGGSHDKTNVVNSVISVINNIGMDHKALIGPTLKDTAREKSGIIKKDSIVILGDVEKKLVPILEQKAKQEHSEVYRLTKDFYINNIKKDRYGYTFDYVDKNNKITDISLSSIANYQIKNVAVAIEVFIKYQNQKNKTVDFQLIKDSVKQVQVLTRMQVVNQEPLVILDGAHNEPAARALVKSLNDFYPQKNVKFLVAMMKDKEFDKVIKIFEQKSDVITLTTFAENRSLKESDVVNMSFDSKWENYIDKFITESSNQILVITGSLHFTSTVLNYFNKK
ncbi:bifunctional folylpolyglutamate synthase/dihydrofolate synthase [Companilactobacillus sp. RD055328]|uniref:bifunctional folylpolyglutamate synthase/dihydrofolate synthase n=1 Tax=Companilactobacillus sp. RD055328 TaxID=2916634 RepID=UPI001FC81C59|nr:Mur ligase family protein [Companilactobacillus sp. RD055328]GKQ42861.1 bifunctional folylpolyglutamate synthase/dihydrofolate synthase [Companilactobacillus sp. RD055328]